MFYPTWFIGVFLAIAFAVIITAKLEKKGTFDDKNDK